MYTLSCLDGFTDELFCSKNCQKTSKATKYCFWEKTIVGKKRRCATPEDIEILKMKGNRSGSGCVRWAGGDLMCLCEGNNCNGEYIATACLDVILSAGSDIIDATRIKREISKEACDANCEPYKEPTTTTKKPQQTTKTEDFHKMTGTLNPGYQNRTGETKIPGGQ